jgi:CHASE2 domain-containing sensor protein
MSAKQPGHARGRVSALWHFGFGGVVVLLAALLSHWMHEFSPIRDLSMLNLDIVFLGAPARQESERIAIVSITEDDYHNQAMFGGTSPLRVSTIQDLIMASARSGARVIGVDLDTSAWSAQEREQLRLKLDEEHARLGAPLPRVVWALGGWVDPGSGTLMTTALQGLAGDQCEAVPASIPDRFGVVRGYLPALNMYEDGKAVVKPGLAALLAALDRSPSESCAPPGLMQQAVDPASAEEGERLVNYTREDGIAELSAGTLLGAVEGEPFRNSNPLKGRLVLIGGSFSEARDKYVTPAGYLDGVEILARSARSVERAVVEARPSLFLAVDLVFGACLLVATFYVHRAWSLILSFVLLPVVALTASFWIFRVYGLFASSVPIVLGVLIHHLLEHLYEHHRLKQEVRELKAKLAESVK